MKVTVKHLQFLAQKSYQSLYLKVHPESKISIHDLIPVDKRLQPYGRERVCEVNNTLMLIKSWRNRSNDYLFEKMAESCRSDYNFEQPNSWRLRLFRKLIREHNRENYPKTASK